MAPEAILLHYAVYLLCPSSGTFLFMKRRRDQRTMLFAVIIFFLSIKVSVMGGRDKKMLLLSGSEERIQFGHGDSYEILTDFILQCHLR